MRTPSIKSVARNVAWLALSQAGIVTAVVPVHAQTVVNTCGQAVSGSGLLTADLDCTGFPDAAVTLTPGAKLDLAGFTLTGGDADGIACEGSCSVASSSIAMGVVQNAGDRGIASTSGVFEIVKMKLRNLRVSGSGNHGAVPSSIKDGVLNIKDSEISNNAGAGAIAFRKVRVKRSNISNNGWHGVRGTRVSVVDSQIDENQGSGVDSDPGLVCRRSSLSANQEHGADVFLQGDLAGGRLKFKDCNVDGNQIDGLFIDTAADTRLAVSGGSLSDNGRDGIHFQNDVGFDVLRSKVKLSGTVVSGNTGNGIWASADEPLDQMRLRKVAISDNGASGVSGRFFLKGLRVSQSEISGNGTYGIAHLADPADGSAPCQTEVSRLTVVTGNGIGVDCGVSLTCADIGGCEAPVIDANTTCDTSYNTESGFPGSSWGVCSLD